MKNDSQAGIQTSRWWSDRRLLGVVGLLAVSIGAFLLAPWSLQDKSLAALHGLCAQQPGHSFWFGDARLPFDARMTGIYGGFLIVGIYLLSRGRLYRSGPPPASVLITAAVFVAIMGVDGVNSTLNDFGMPYVYEPSNHLRYFTGAMTGTSLALFIWLIAGGVLWSPQVAIDKPIMRSWKEFLPIAALVTMFWALLQMQVAFLFAPIAVFLVISAVIVVSSIALVALRLATGGFQKALRPLDLSRSAVVAILIAYAVMSSISGARFMLESMATVQAGG
ncbi:MAG: DUF2085 domain-containing protein [Sphaerobacteraceae bacterium]|nr:MAG: DUF2085 domain-containing protein [Sphaerobacteraceae bacterium]